jgi:hypothetical protein
MSEVPQSLKMVRVGLALVAFGVSLLWVLFGWANLGLFVEREDPERFLLGWPATVLTILWPTFLLMQILGQLLCLAGTPREWHMRASEAPALGLNVIHLALSLALLLAPLSLSWLPLVAAGSWALLLLAPALHLLFLSNLAPRIGQEPLGKRAELLIFVLLVLLVFPVLLLLTGLLLGRLAGPWGLIVLLVLMSVALLLMLVSLVMYMNLHLAVYHAIPRYLETFEEKRKLSEAGWVDQPPW